MKKIFTISLFLLIGFYTYAQEIYWANKVDSVSSEYSKEEASAYNILGKPNVDIRGRWSSYAWAVQPNNINTEGVETAYIDISFGKEKTISQIAVFESFNPGAISEILIYDYRDWERVYVDTFVMAKTGFVTFDGNIDENLRDTLASIKKDWNLLMKDKEFQSKKDYNILNVFFDEREVVMVRIVINLLSIDGWNQIDAVGATNSKDTIGFQEINFADRSLLTEREAQNMGEAINTPYSEINPVITPDGKTLYFSRSYYDDKYYAETQNIFVSDMEKTTQMECYKRKNPIYEQVENWDYASPYNKSLNNIMPNEIFSFTNKGNKMYLNNLYFDEAKSQSDSILSKETSGISTSSLDSLIWKDASSEEIEEFQDFLLPDAEEIKISEDKNLLLLTVKDSTSNNKLLYVNIRIQEKWYNEPILLGNIHKETLFQTNYKAQEESIHYRFFVDTTNIDSLIIGNIFWSKPEPVLIKNFKNTSKYISVWVNPNDDIMLLAIENEKSLGKRDLFVSEKDENGNWNEPTSLGNIVNTLNDEASPFLDDDGITLYFASSGHNGFGEMDIYVSRRIGPNWDKWTEPKNLGSKINTGGSENMFIIEPNTRVAYYSSTTKSVGCNNMADIYEIQMSKPVELTFAGKVVDVFSQTGVSHAEVTLKALDENNNEAFRSLTVISEKYTGDFSIKTNEFIDANKLSKFALIAKKTNYQQTNSKGDSIVFDIADIDLTSRKINIDQQLYMKTMHGGNPIEKDTLIKENDKGNAGVDTVFVGDTVYITKTEVVTKYQTIDVDEGIDGQITMPVNRVNSCDVLFHKGDLYLIPQIGPDSLIRMKYLKEAYYKEFDYNQTDFSLDEDYFQEMVKDLMFKQKKFGQVTVHIVASASRIPTKAYRSNQTLAEQRYSEAIRRIKIALGKNGISEKDVKFQEHSFVQGKKYAQDHNEYDYRKFQYVKIWLVACGSDSDE